MLSHGSLQVPSADAQAVVYSKLPVRSRISPDQGLLFIESIRERFTVVTLLEREHFEVIASAAGRGIAGGKIYDALILRCAEKSKAEAVYTRNLEDFRQLASIELAGRIRTP